MSKSKPALRTIAITDDALLNKIYEFRGQKVMLDSDLAELYGVESQSLGNFTFTFCIDGSG